MKISRAISFNMLSFYRMAALSTLAFFSGNSAALHGRIQFPTAEEQQYYNVEPTIPGVITYCHPALCSFGDVKLGASISGVIQLTTDFGWEGSYTYSTDTTYDALQVTNLSIVSQGGASNVLLDFSNTFTGNGGNGPVTDYYTSGFTSRISHGYVQTDLREFTQQYSGLIEVTPLGVTDFYIAESFRTTVSDLGLQILFDFDRQRIDFVVPYSEMSNAILSGNFYDLSTSTGGPGPIRTSEGYLLASTRVVPLPGSLALMMVGVGFLITRKLSSKWDWEAEAGVGPAQASKMK